jgi:putative acetyltransferase
VQSTIRDARVDDQDAIYRLLCDAFGRCAEADLVEALRDCGALAVSLVAEHEGELVGYIALPRLRSPKFGLALAPLAVAAAHRGKGIGSRLIKEGLNRARDAGNEIVFVLGEPDYYARQGFSLEAGQPFPCAYAGPTSWHFGWRMRGAGPRR